MILTVFLTYAIVMVVVNFCLVFSAAKEAAQLFVNKYPGVILKKPSFIWFFGNFVLFILVSAVPVVNIMMALTVAKYRNKLIDDVVEKKYKECVEKNERHEEN